MNGFVSLEPKMLLFLMIVNKRRFGMVPYMAFSIDSDCEPLEKVKVLSLTLVRLYFAIAPSCRAVLCAIRYVGFGIIRFTNSCPTRTLKTNLEFVSLFMK